MSITVEGVLKRDARYGRRGMHDAVVTLCIDTGTQCLPFEAHVRIGDKPDDHAQAQALAALHRRGAMVRVVCERIDRIDDHGEARYSMRDCTSATVNGTALK